MQIKQVTVELLKNRGNYENTKIAISADIDEKDDVSEKITELQTFIDFKLNEDARQERYLQCKEDLELLELTENEKASRIKFIEKYDDLQKKLGELEFYHVKE
jgi:hypothetical protein